MVCWFDFSALKKIYSSDWIGSEEYRRINEQSSKWYISRISEAEFYIWLRLEDSSLKKDFEERFVTMDINPECEAANSGWRKFLDGIFAMMEKKRLKDFREAIEFFFSEMLLIDKKRNLTKSDLLFVTSNEEVKLDLSNNDFRSYIVN